MRAEKKAGISCPGCGKGGSSLLLSAKIREFLNSRKQKENQGVQLPVNLPIHNAAAAIKAAAKGKTAIRIICPFRLKPN